MQTPDWVFKNKNGGNADRETLLKRLEDHIKTVVGRYKGRIKGWDVVNEALNPYTNRLPENIQQQATERYVSLFNVFAKHRKILDRVTFWGVTDGDSWLNNWPTRGRTNYPLLFDRQNVAKPALFQVIQTAGSGK